MQTRFCDSPDLHAWIVEHDPLRVVPLRGDEDRYRFDVRGPYVERYWLPVLGPSCVFALRRLADALERCPNGLEVPLAPFARSVGLGTGIGRWSPIVRTLTRLDDFGFAHAAWDHYAVRVTAPALSRRQARLLPDFLAALHRHEDAARSELAPAVSASCEAGGSVGEAGPADSRRSPRVLPMVCHATSRPRSKSSAAASDGSTVASESCMFG
jgi:hypothetical protein